MHGSFLLSKIGSNSSHHRLHRGGDSVAGAYDYDSLSLRRDSPLWGDGEIPG